MLPLSSLPIRIDSSTYLRNAKVQLFHQIYLFWKNIYIKDTLFQANLVDWKWQGGGPNSSRRSSSTAQFQWINSEKKKIYYQRESLKINIHTLHSLPDPEWCLICQVWCLLSAIEDRICRWVWQSNLMFKKDWLVYSSRG